MSAAPSRPLVGLLGALASPRLPPPVLALTPAPWQVATYLAEAVRGTDGARRIGAAAREFAFALPPRPAATHGLARARAIALRDRVAALSAVDHVPVLLAVLRALLDDAPTDAAVTLDRAITDAARAEAVTPTAAHLDAAARLVAEVLT